MYSYKSEYPIQLLPERIRLSNGLTRTNSFTFTEEEIIDAGYIKVSDPPTPNMFQKVSWNGTNWVLENLNESEKQDLIKTQWKIIRQERNTLLSNTDWIIVKNLEHGEPIPQNFVKYRQDLRDITLQPDPFNIVWPQYELQNG